MYTKHQKNLLEADIKEFLKWYSKLTKGRPTQLRGHQLSRQNRDKKLPKRESKSATFSTVG